MRLPDACHRAAVVCSHTRLPSLNRTPATSEQGKRTAVPRVIGQDAGSSSCPSQQQRLASLAPARGAAVPGAGRDARQSHGRPGNPASADGGECKIIALERKLALKISTENAFLLHIRKTKNFQEGFQRSCF